MALLDQALHAPLQLGPRCAGFESRALDADLPLQMYVGANVTTEQAGRVLSSLAGYFAPYHVRFVRTGAVTRLTQSSLIGDGTPSEALRPLATFMRAHGRRKEADRHLNVVVLEHLATVHSPALRYFSRFEGLSLSDRLRASGDPLATTLALDEATVPTLLIGIQDVTMSVGSQGSLAPAHELGHLLGLSHPADNVGHDLMSQSQQTCVPALTTAQLETVRASLRAWPSSDPAR